MLKRMELASVDSCLNKAGPEEPLFVLRAKDKLSSQAVRLWAAMASGIHEPHKIEEALKLADQMDIWRSPPPIAEER